MSSDDNDTKENAMLDPSEELPTQASPTDTSNWDEKVSSDPSGEKYIRSLSEDEIVED